MRGLLKIRKKRFYDLALTLFIVGLIITSYLAISEEFVIFCFTLTIVSFLRKRAAFMKHHSLWLFILLYYFATTIIGYLLGWVDIKGLLEYIIQYLFIPVIMSVIVIKTDSMKSSLNAFKGFILISAIYGLIESILRYNILPSLFSAPVMERIATMNRLTYKYQSSSFFLHYTLFGIFLLVGFAINMMYPYKKKGLNVFFSIICLIDLYFCKSRMCWLAFIVLLLYDLRVKNKLTNKMIERGTLAVVSAFLIIVLFWNQFSQMFEIIHEKFAVIGKYGLDYGSYGQRIGTLLHIPEYMIQYPIRGLFGTGYDSIKTVFLSKYSYFQGYSVADNQLTTFLVEIGIIGTALVIVSIINFFRKNRNKKSLSKYVLIIMMFSSITIDVIGTIYITALAIWPFVFFYCYERGKGHVQYCR